jgi:hypothetical protein
MKIQSIARSARHSEPGAAPRASYFLTYPKDQERKLSVSRVSVFKPVKVIIFTSAAADMSPSLED